VAGGSAGRNRSRAAGRGGGAGGAGLGAAGLHAATVSRGACCGGTRSRRGCRRRPGSPRRTRRSRKTWRRGDRPWWQHVLAEPRRHAELRELLAVAAAPHLQDWLATAFVEPWIVDELEVPAPAPATLAALVEAGRRAGRRAGDAARERHPPDRGARPVRRRARAGPRGRPRGRRAGPVPGRPRGGLFRRPAKAVTDALGRMGPAREYFATTRDPRRSCSATAWQPSWRAVANLRKFLRAFVDWADTASGARARRGDLRRDGPAGRRLVRESSRGPARRAGPAAGDPGRRVPGHDPDQLALLRELLRREAEGRRARLLRGDAKQSIYKFRGADLPALDRFETGYPALVGCPPRGSAADAAATFSAGRW